MPRFLIEIPHDDDRAACVKALHALHGHGSHWVTHAEFGCADGAHVAWLIVELDDRAQARRVVPPEFRDQARIVRLKRFDPEKIAAMVAELGG